MQTTDGNGTAMRGREVRGHDDGGGAALGQGSVYHAPAVQARPAAARALRLEIDIEAADLDELAKREALARLRAKGHAVDEARFFSRATVTRYDDGAILVTVE